MIDSATMLWINELSARILPGLITTTLVGALLLVAVAVSLRLRQRTSASTRHFAWLLAIVAPLLMPIAMYVLPEWPVVPNEIVSMLPAERVSLAASNHGATRENPFEPATSVAATAAQTSTHPRLSITSWICALWMLGVGGLLGSWSLGLLSLWRLARRSIPFHDESLNRILRDAMRRIGVNREVRVVSSDSRAMPMVWGSLRPTILLPANVSEWSAETIQNVLLHELAHIRRCDWLAHGLSLLARSLFWFNPLVWFAARKLRCECERACDDLLLRTGASACDYADTLLSVTRAAVNEARPPQVALGMSSASELEWRIHSILDHTRHRYGITHRTAWLMMTVFSGVVCGAAMLQSQGVEAARSSPVVRLGHVDDSAEGRRSIAGSGHAVRFDRPGDVTRVTAIELFASRYGTVDPPHEDFHLYLLDENKQLIAAYPIAYSQIERAAERWYTFPIRACEVPKQFYVAVTFNPHRTKGVYLGYDESAQSSDSRGESNSLVGRPTTGFEAFDQNREWMIRAVMIDQQQPANPFDPPANPFDESGR